jgi:2-keto-4-pentenoate hydratase/2-oxohepta-3-ene-1,7-dioic acid hydratase in catechol pathway
MRLRRIQADNRLEVQVLDNGRWLPAPDPAPLASSAFSEQWQRAVAEHHLTHSDHLLPFQPVSFRDFMLYERHNIDASRGLLQRFHPFQHIVTSAVEMATRRPFAMLKPRPLFYRRPMYYMSNHLTFVPSGTPIDFPAYSHALDYELEIGFVLAAPLLNASPAEAVEAIGAFVVLNDFSARDVQRDEMNSGFGPQKSKHFTSSMSATAVTADEILPRINNLSGSVSINGHTVSTVSSAGMQWTIGEVLAHASRSEQLFPGEMFGTGTLPGGSGMEIGQWLQPGDTLLLRLDDIGEIHHTISGA